MKTSPTASDRNQSWAGAVIFVLVLVGSSANLSTVTLSYFAWISFSIAAVLLIPFAFREFFLSGRMAREHSADALGRNSAISPAILLLLAIALPLLYGAPVSAGLMGMAKLAAILFVAMPLLAARPYLAERAFQGLVAAVWINTALMAAGLAGCGAFASMMSAGRWGTALNWPGPLWRLALSVLFYAGYLAIKKRSILALGLFVSSTILVFLDGARAGFLLAGLEGIALGLVLSWERGRLRSFLFVSVVILGAGIVVLAGSSELADMSLPDQGALARIGKLVLSLASGGGGLQEADLARYQMLQDATQAIHDHPLLGTGFGSTQWMSDSGPEDIHMSYLQVWANLGMVGLLAYTWLTWGWLPWLPEIVHVVHAEKDVHKKAIYYNAIVLLTVNGLGACTYPLGTEWSDWGFFLTAYALVWKLRRAASIPRQLACVISPSA